MDARRLVPVVETQARLCRRGWAVRTRASRPGLGPDWWRLAAREEQVTARFAADLPHVLRATT